MLRTRTHHRMPAGRGALGLALAALLAGAAGPAAAAGTATFRLDATGSGSYAAVATGDVSSYDEDADFSWSASIAEFTFTDGKLTSMSGFSSAVTARGRMDAVHRHSDGRTTTVRCSGDSVLEPGAPEVDFDRHVVWADGAPEVILFRPFQQLDVTTPCVDSDGDESPGNMLFSDALDQPLGEEDFDVAFTMPKVAIDHGQVIHVTRSRPSAVTKVCTSFVAAQSCTFQWAQEVRLTRIDGGPGDPPPPGSVEPPVRPEVEPPAPPVEPPVPTRFEPVVNRGQAALSRRGDRAGFSVRCPRGCRGTATVTAGGRRVATHRFAVRAGKAGRRVTVRFGSRAACRAVLRARGVRVTLRLRAADGGGEATRTLVLRLPRG